ncbi:sensor histidine kinase [Pantanalinema rosaneae CENA516]|uniref:sensor histidine kinase n=1 Tax=Pantanalinema rosaneae TaxID=1620701 RepID=UPI003D6E208C
MSQPCLLPQADVTLQQLMAENAELQKYLAAQKKVIASLERRVGRSLDSLGVHVTRLSEQGNSTANWHQHLSSVQSEVDALCDLLADTMLLQKLEAGKVEVHLEALNVQPVLASVSRHLLEPKHGGQVRLLCEIDANLPLAWADQDLTEAVLMDLLARGLRYSDADIAVILGASADREWLDLRVTAQRFAPPGNREFATEIALCCRRIEVQRGKIACQLRPDGLQTVTISLPLAVD